MNDTHDLNNDLNAVALLLGRILSISKSSEINKIAANAIERVKDAADKVRDTVALDKEDVIPLCRKLVPEIAETFSLEETMDIQSNNFPKVSKALFKDTITNIFKNAFESGATKIHVFLSGDCLAFSDNGGGFSKEILVNVNNHIPITDKPTGSGTGLKNVRKFAKINGLLTGVNNSNDGACVNFTLDKPKP